MNTAPDLENSTDFSNNIRFADIFNLVDIQHLQDLFADAHGVASIITHPDGTPITKPSNFCQLCNNIIRKTEKGRANCHQSNAVLGRYNPSGPIVQPCLSAGLWNAGASITVGGKHIANWIISQVRNEELDEQRMIQYADEIGANREDFLEALNEVPVMPVGQFKKVSEMLFAFANELSEKAYSNLQLKMQIAEREKATEQLRETEERYRMLFERSKDAIFLEDTSTGNYLDANRAAEIMTGRSLDELKRLKTDEIAPKGATKRLERLLDTNDSQEIGEIEYVRPDGTIRTALLNTIPLSKGYVFEIADDITGRKQAEESLAKLKKAIYTSGEAIFLTDREGVFTFVNPAFTSLYGFSSDEIVGKTTPRIIKSGVLDKSVYEVFWQTLLNGDEVRGELINKRKDGTLITIDGSATPVFDQEKNIIGFLGIQRDITNRKQAEEELYESRQILEAIINTIPVRVFWKDKNLTYLGCNTPFALDAGFEKPEDVIGKDDYTMGWSEQAELYRADDRLVIGSGKPKLLIEEPQTTSSGEQIYLLTSKVPLKDATGEIIGVLGTYYDITQRKQTEEALRQSKRELSTLMANLPGMVYSCLNDQDWTMKFVSEGSFDLTGYLPDELTDNKIISYEEIIHPDDREMVSVTIRDALEKKAAFTLEYRIVTKCGAVKHVWERGQGLYSSNDTLHHIEGFITDITEHKRAEAEQARLLYIMESSLNEIYVFDSITLIFDYVNQGALRNLGYTREAMRGMTPLDLKPEFTEESFRQTIMPLLRHEQEQLLFNTVHRRADGSLYPVEVHLQLVELEGQRVFLAMILDITERKLAEEEQRKAQRLLSISQRLAHIGSWETEISTGKLSWSDEVYRILGFPAVSPMSLNTALSVFPPDELVRFNKAISSALQDDVPYNIDYTIIRNDGQVRIIHDEGEVIRDEHGQATWMFGTTQDITERKRAEEALRKSEALQGKMVANIGDVIVIIDQNGINRYKSPNIEKWFGWRPEEVIGFSAWENIHPDDLNSVQKIFGALLGEPNATGTTECRYQCKDGSYKWIEFTGVNLLHDPDIRGILGNYHDINERKQKEQELIFAKEHAEESDRLKSSFLANMSHEIRTPMNSILGFAEILKEPDLTGEQQQEYIGIIEKSGARMVNIINDIVDISKIESGQMNVSISETNVNKQIEYISDFFKPEAEQKGIQLSIKNTLPDKKAILRTDKEKLYAILTNLVKNAIKFTKSGSIEIGCNIVETLHATSLLEFCVRDTGIGIPPEQKEFIFERFRQGSESLNKNYEGAGLGLAISKAYVEMLGGKIWVESEPGKGSVFYFTLPYTPETKEIAAKNLLPENEIESQVSSLKILISEDDEGSEKLISIAVKKRCQHLL